MYTRCKEHVGLTRGIGGSESYIKKHLLEVHDGRKGIFKARVTQGQPHQTDKGGSLIRRAEGSVLKNKSEWFKPPLYRLQSQVLRE